MKKYKLSLDDYKNINNLIKIAKNIYSLYQILYKLDIEDKKNTKEYKDIIKQISILKEGENKLYNLDFSKYEEYLSFILDKLSSNVNVKTTENIINLNYNNLHFQRILITLFNKMMNHKDAGKKLTPKELTEMQKLIKDINIPKLFNESIKLQDSIKEDILNAFLFFLEEEINYKSNKYLKNKLLKIKYHTAYINQNIEKEMLKNNFNLSDLYLTSELTSELYKIDNKLYKDMIKNYSINTILDQIKELLKLTDSDFLEDNTNITAIARTCLLRACLINLNDDDIMTLNELFHISIEEDIYLIFHYEDRISESIIADAFKKVSNDRQKPKILSLKQK
ncbi:MAG: hypothetical protein ACI310_04940 [Bacilli bacterium]